MAQAQTPHSETNTLFVTADFRKVFVKEPDGRMHEYTLTIPGNFASAQYVGVTQPGKR